LGRIAQIFQEILSNIRAIRIENYQVAKPKNSNRRKLYTRDKANFKFADLNPGRLIGI